MISSHIILKDGTSLPGFSPDWFTEPGIGEVVFNTGMTGYIETLTDPSYAGQIITFTYPLIGNYGVPSRTVWESGKIHARGVVLSEACLEYSHHSAKRSLLDWLKDENVPVITNIDTRELTKHLRETGVMMGAITTSDALPHLPTENTHIVTEVSIKKPKIYPSKAKGKKKNIIAVDCGMKENIIRCLTDFPFTVTRVPFDYDYSQESFDGVFLSNGPGDPAACTKTIAILKQAMARKKPIFGICLGSQLMALAAGAKTYKLPYGHRGHNQPCINTDTDRCYLTSQNHGYAVNEKTLQKNWRTTFRNLNDGSVEGIAHNTLPFFSVQFHPEAAPGPTDTRWLFDEFNTYLK